MTINHLTQCIQLVKCIHFNKAYQFVITLKKSKILFFEFPYFLQKICCWLTNKTTKSVQKMYIIYIMKYKCYFCITYVHIITIQNKYS